MATGEFEATLEAKSGQLRQAVERQEQSIRLSQPGPLAQMPSPIGGPSTAGTHASRLNRIVAFQPSRAGRSLLQLQRQYGNRYVQRVIALARKADGDAEAAPSEVEQAIQRARGGGQALDKLVRAQMEPAFGADFGGVRVHTDTEADALNRSVSARAFTTGQDIFFRQGGYNPGNSSGQELLAHELTHVVQQTGTVQPKLTVSQPDDEYEQEADRVAGVVTQQEQRTSEAKDEEEEQPETFQAKVAPGGLPIVRRRAVSKPLAHAMGAERSWTAENRQGFVDTLGPGRYVLWNFDVSSAELKPEHKAKLDEIAREWQIAALSPQSIIRIEGHASRSGPGKLNEQLSADRAFAVNWYLYDRGVDVKRMDLYHRGSSAPWFPNITGSTKARNRRVEVRIILPPAVKPAPRPTLEPPPAKESPAAEQPAEVGDLLPNGEFEFKSPVDPKYAIPAGPYLLIYPSGEISGKFKLKTHRPETIGGSWKSGKFGITLKEKLTQSIEIKADSSGNLGLSFYNTPLHPELMVQLLEVHKPVSLNVSESVKIADLDLGDGIKVTGEVQIKCKFGVGPGPGLAVSFGTAGVIVAGSIAGTALIVYATARITSDAREQGIRLAGKVASRSCYAWRVAGEATGDYGFAIAFSNANNYKRLEVYDDAYRGWKLADDGIHALPAEQRKAFSELIKRRYGSTVEDIERTIFWRVGGVSDKDIPLPTNPQDLVR